MGAASRACPGGFLVIEGKTPPRAKPTNFLMLREKRQGLNEGGSRRRGARLAAARAARRQPPPAPGGSQRPASAGARGRGGAASPRPRPHGGGGGVPSPSTGPGAGVAHRSPAAGPARAGVLGPAVAGAAGALPGGRSRFQAPRGGEPAFPTWQQRGRRARPPAPGLRGAEAASWPRPRPGRRENDSAA